MGNWPFECGCRGLCIKISPDDYYLLLIGEKNRIEIGFKHYWKIWDTSQGSDAKRERLNRLYSNVFINADEKSVEEVIQLERKVIRSARCNKAVEKYDNHQHWGSTSMATKLYAFLCWFKLKKTLFAGNVYKKSEEDTWLIKVTSLINYRIELTSFLK